MLIQTKAWKQFLAIYTLVSTPQYLLDFCTRHIVHLNTFVIILCFYATFTFSLNKNTMFCILYVQFCNLYWGRGKMLCGWWEMTALEASQSLLLYSPPYRSGICQPAQSTYCQWRLLVTITTNTLWWDWLDDWREIWRNRVEGDVGQTNPCDYFRWALYDQFYCI